MNGNVGRILYGNVFNQLAKFLLYITFFSKS